MENENRRTEMEKETLREIMAAYDEYRTKWIEQNGSDAGFNEWFTKQIIG
jgi:hypothetical protein